MQTSWEGFFVLVDDGFRFVLTNRHIDQNMLTNIHELFCHKSLSIRRQIAECETWLGSRSYQSIVCDYGELAWTVDSFDQSLHRYRSCLTFAQDGIDGTEASVWRSLMISVDPSDWNKGTMAFKQFVGLQISLHNARSQLDGIYLSQLAHKTTGYKWQRPIKASPDHTLPVMTDRVSFTNHPRWWLTSVVSKFWAILQGAD